MKTLQEPFAGFVLALERIVEGRDPRLLQHSRRVAAAVALLTEELQLPPETRTGIEVGARLHDLGKVGIPDAILNRPARLTDDEYARVKRHPAMGEAMLKPVKFPWPEVFQTVRSHHEKWNGQGYPDGLAGPDIPLGARMVGLCDMYDAMLLTRPHRSPFPVDKALGVIKQCAHVFFDPTLVAAFERIVDRVPRPPTTN